METPKVPALNTTDALVLLSAKTGDTIVCSASHQQEKLLVAAKRLGVLHRMPSPITFLQYDQYKAKGGFHLIGFLLFNPIAFAERYYHDQQLGEK